MCPRAGGVNNDITKKYTNHEEDLPASVYKLMIEERGKSVVLENTLSGGLCGIVTVSGGSCDRRNRHSVTDVGEMATTSGGALSTNVTAASESLACSCEAVSTPSTRVFGDGSPNMVVSDGVRRLCRATSEGKEERDDGVDVGMTPTSPGRCRVVEPIAST
jgi:hypothetical protein